MASIAPGIRTPQRTTVSCGRCRSARDLWLVNPRGGYGRNKLWACSPCLATHWSFMVQRLLDAYSDGDADELRAELAKHVRGGGLCRPTNSYGQYWLDWHDVVKKSRNPLQPREKCDASGR